MSTNEAKVRVKDKVWEPSSKNAIHFDLLMNATSLSESDRLYLKQLLPCSNHEGSDNSIDKSWDFIKYLRELAKFQIEEKFKNADSTYLAGEFVSWLTQPRFKHRSKLRYDENTIKDLLAKVLEDLVRDPKSMPESLKLLLRSIGLLETEEAQKSNLGRAEKRTRSADMPQQDAADIDKCDSEKKPQKNEKKKDEKPRENDLGRARAAFINSLRAFARKAKRQAKGKHPINFSHLADDFIKNLNETNWQRIIREFKPGISRFETYLTGILEKFVRRRKWSKEIPFSELYDKNRMNFSEKEESYEEYLQRIFENPSSVFSDCSEDDEEEQTYSWDEIEDICCELAREHLPTSSIPLGYSSQGCARIHFLKLVEKYGHKVIDYYLFVAERLSYEDIQAKYNKSYGAARTYIHRLRKKLEPHIEDDLRNFFQVLIQEFGRESTPNILAQLGNWLLITHYPLPK